MAIPYSQTLRELIQTFEKQIEQSKQQIANGETHNGIGAPLQQEISHWSQRIKQLKKDLKQCDRWI